MVCCFSSALVLTGPGTIIFGLPSVVYPEILVRVLAHDRFDNGIISLGIVLQVLDGAAGFLSGDFRQELYVVLPCFTVPQRIHAYDRCLCLQCQSGQPLAGAGRPAEKSTKAPLYQSMFWSSSVPTTPPCPSRAESVLEAPRVGTMETLNR